MSKLHQKVDDLMDEIQIMIEANAHIDGDLEELENLLSKVSIYWSHLGDENIDYIQAVQNAIEEKSEWQIAK